MRAPIYRGEAISSKNQIFYLPDCIAAIEHSLHRMPTLAVGIPSFIVRTLVLYIVYST
jgi:hypothetical protein